MKRSTLFAFVLLVVLVGVVYLVERGGDGSAADADRVFDVTEDAIERVEIRQLGSEAVAIEREGEHFHIVAPIDAAVDEREVDLVLSNLATMAAVRSFAREADTDPAEFGLDAPTLEVEFRTQDGSSHGVRFGKDTLTASNQYAERVGSDEVLVVGNHFERNLAKTAWDLRDKTIFHLPEDAEPKRVTITRGDDIIQLAEDGGVWMTAGSPRVRVDRFEVIGTVARFRRAEMLALPDGAEIDSPTLRLEVAFAGDVDPMTLEIGEQRHVDYLARVAGRGQVFLLEGGLVGELQKDATGWWSRKLLHHATTETTLVHVVAGGEERSMNREEAQGLLSALSQASVETIETDVPAGDPTYVVIVSTDEARDEIAFRPHEGTAYAIRRNEDVALRLSAEAWETIEGELLPEAPADG